MADQNPSSSSENSETPHSSSPLEEEPVRAPRRPVYEPTLLPPRKRRRLSPWIVIPGLLLLLGALLYALLVAPHRRRFVPSAGEIVSVSDQGTPGHPHLWVANEDGAGAHRLTKGVADETAPAWSPDGSQLAFLSSRAGGDPQIFVVDADGRNPVQVTHSGGGKADPQFAPSDNTMLGYLSGGALTVADVTTGQTSRVLPTVSEESRTQTADTPLQTTAVVGFAWAPVKDRAQQGLAATEDVGGAQALVVLPTLAGKARDTRDDTPGSPPLAAANGLTLGWSPDGALLAVALQDVAGLPAGRRASALTLFDAQGNPGSPRPLALVPSASAAPQNPVFSADGAQVLFEAWQGSDLAHQRSVGLFAVPVDGSAPPHPLVVGPVQNARLSADGQTLFFLRGRPDGGHDLCRAASDGTGAVRLSDGQADVTDVAVSPQTARP